MSRHHDYDEDGWCKTAGCEAFGLTSDAGHDKPCPYKNSITNQTEPEDIARWYDSMSMNQTDPLDEILDNYDQDVNDANSHKVLTTLPMRHDKAKAAINAEIAKAELAAFEKGFKEGINNKKHIEWLVKSRQPLEDRIAKAVREARIDELRTFADKFDKNNPLGERLVKEFGDGSVLYDLHKLENYINDRLAQIEEDGE